MFHYPEHYMISSGTGSAKHQLVAFDNALISAGISDYNLLRVSSILPSACLPAPVVDMPKGSALLVAYGSISSNVLGETIASAVAIGIPQDPNQIGVIMEYEGHCSKEIAEANAREMAALAMENHGIPCKEVVSSATEATVIDDNYVSVISAVALW